MEKTGTEPVYPAAPLEQPVPNEQQTLLPPAPPTYDQATGTAATVTPATTAPGPTFTPATTAGPNVVIVTPAPVAVVGQFGPEPTDMLCPYCNNFTRTRVSFHPTARTHLFALMLCVFQLYCCICLPYCMPSCMDTNHYCGMCGHYLGTYERV